SHIVVHRYTESIDDWPLLARRVESVPGVVAVTPFVSSRMLIRTGGAVEGIDVRGIDPPSVVRVRSLDRELVHGDLGALSLDKESDGAPPPIVIGEALRQKLLVSPGDEVQLVSPFGGRPTPVGSLPLVKRFRVHGIFHSKNNFQLESAVVYIGLERAQKFFHGGGGVDGLEVKVADIFKAHSIAERLRGELGLQYSVQDWSEIAPAFYSALKTERSLMFMIGSLIILVAGFAIVATLVMMAMEKYRDIAILKSMGATSRSVLKIFAFQGILIGSAGAALGVLGGLLTTYNLDNIENFIESLLGYDVVPGEVYFFENLPWSFDPLQIGIVVVIALSVSLLATVYPSWQAAKIDPAEALRYE
ncbi:MAG: FtsX-like permease family protein, partial [Vicinamibacteria bacterium]